LSSEVHYRIYAKNRPLLARKWIRKIRKIGRVVIDLRIESSKGGV
jgi:hypothetical protein